MLTTVENTTMKQSIPAKDFTRLNSVKNDNEISIQKFPNDSDQMQTNVHSAQEPRRPYWSPA